ncbi:MAG: ArsR/SmtB family transcription factor [Gammaproteobacteria bacterium]
MDTAVRTIKAAGDPTRIRLLALLAAGEAAVGELQQILGQSQPRVSRHLRILDEAGLVTKFRDGQWIYYCLAVTSAEREFAQNAVGFAGVDDATLRGDAAALATVKKARERDAFAAPMRAASAGGAFTAGRPNPVEFAAAFEDAVGTGSLGDVLDVGSGAGGLLCLLGKRARQVVGVDVSKRMRLLARSRVHQSGLANCTVRNGDLAALPFADETFDLVVLDDVLGASADRRGGLREARRVLRRDGRLVIFDRIRPVARRLSGVDDGALVENQLAAELGEVGMRVGRRAWLPGRAMEYALLVAIPATEYQRTGTDA